MKVGEGGRWVKVGEGSCPFLIIYLNNITFDAMSKVKV